MANFLFYRYKFVQATSDASLFPADSDEPVSNELHNRRLAEDLQSKATGIKKLTLYATIKERNGDKRTENYENEILNCHEGVFMLHVRNNKSKKFMPKDSEEAQKISVDLINDNPNHLRQYFKRKDNQMLLEDFTMPAHHPVLDMDISDKEFEVLTKAWEIQPENYEELILLQGIGPKKIRALALISDLVYGEPASWKDPVKYSFTHGGKDGFPYPVDREVYDNSIQTIRDAIDQARIKKDTKLKAIKRLDDFIS